MLKIISSSSLLMKNMNVLNHENNFLQILGRCFIMYVCVCMYIYLKVSYRECGGRELPSTASLLRWPQWLRAEVGKHQENEISYGMVELQVVSESTVPPCQPPHTLIALPDWYFITGIAKGGENNLTWFWRTERPQIFLFLKFTGSITYKIQNVYQLLKL